MARKGQKTALEMLEEYAEKHSGVAAALTGGRTKVLLSVDQHDLKVIDKLAADANMSRSEYMVASALTRRRQAALYNQVGKLRSDVDRLAGMLEEYRDERPTDELRDAVGELVGVLSRRDVPDDVKKLVREVLDAGRVVW